MALVSMEVSKDLSHFSSVLKSSKQAKNRAHAIRWIKEVKHTISIWANIMLGGR